MDFARSFFAARPTCSFKAATCGRSTATFLSCTIRCSRQLPAGCVIDGEIVIAGPNGLDFDALQLRLHPAASRVAKLAKETPASFVAFDVLAVDGRNVMSAAQNERRALLENDIQHRSKPPVHLTPMTRDRVDCTRSGSSTSKARAWTA